MSYFSRGKNTQKGKLFRRIFEKWNFVSFVFPNQYLEEADANADASDHGDVALDLLGEAGEAAFGVDLHCSLEKRV